MHSGELAGVESMAVPVCLCDRSHLVGSILQPGLAVLVHRMGIWSNLLKNGFIPDTSKNSQ